MALHQLPLSSAASQIIFLYSTLHFSLLSVHCSFAAHVHGSLSSKKKCRQGEWQRIGYEVRNAEHGVHNDEQEVRSEEQGKSGERTRKERERAGTSKGRDEKERGKEQGRAREEPEKNEGRGIRASDIPNERHPAAHP